MYGLTPDFFLSILRQVLTVAGTYLAAKGILSADMAAQVGGAIVVIVSAGFSFAFHAASNGSIPTVSTTPAIQGNIETRTVITPAQPATPDAAAKPVVATTTVNVPNKTI